jgi:RNA polymerase sigma-70 factor (ECF subfamily)
VARQLRAHWHFRDSSICVNGERRSVFIESKAMRMPLANVFKLRPPGEHLEARSDDELMVLAAAGTSSAFAALASRYAHRLVLFCAKMIGDPRIAEEIAQEAWLAVWEKRASYVPQGKFIVLLYTAARNRCRNHARDGFRRRRWVLDAPSPSLLGAAATAPEQLDGILEREQQRRVHAALGVLPAKLREAVLLRYSEGLSYEDIAAATGTNESTARSRVHHGLKALRASLDRSEAT